MAETKETETCKTCSPIIGGNYGLNYIHNIPTSKIAKYLILLGEIALVDVGSGSGAVLFSLVETMNILYKGQDIKFGHILAVDPNPSKNPDHQDEKLGKFKPFEMTIQEFHKTIPSKGFDNYGALISWPYADPTIDYDALLLLQPKVAIIIVGVYKDFHEDAKQVVQISCSGSAELWNNVIKPLTTLKLAKVEIGKHNYSLYAKSKHIEKKARLDYLEDNKQEYDRVAALPEEQQHIFRFVYVIIRDDYTIPEKFASPLKALEQKAKSKKKATKTA